MYHPNPPFVIFEYAFVATVYVFQLNKTVTDHYVNLN